MKLLKKEMYMFSWSHFYSTIRNSAWESRTELMESLYDQVYYYDDNGNVVAVVEPIDYPNTRIECSYKENDGSWKTTVVDELP